MGISMISFSQELLWAKEYASFNGGGYAADNDATGNIYLLGTNREIVDFDPGPEEATLGHQGGADIFIAKFDKVGNFLWVKGIGSPSNEFGSSIAVDHEGFIFITGNFLSDVDFDPGPNIVRKHSQGSTDIFILKLDPDGNFVWVVTFGNDEHDKGTEIHLAPDNTLLVEGTFRWTVDFDPGPETVLLDQTLTRRVFLMKLTKDGTLVWAKAVGGSADSGQITTDHQGNIYRVGDFNGSVSLDPNGGSTYSLTGTGLYFTKCTANGEFLWGKHVRGPSIHNRAKSIAVDANQNLLVCGQFVDTLDLDPGPQELNVVSQGFSYGGFVLKMDDTGNLLWANTFIGSEDVEPKELILTHTGNIQLTGDFSSSIDFDPGQGEYLLSSVSANREDIFFCMLNEAGGFLSASSIGGDFPDNLIDMNINPSGGIYIIGFHSELADMDPGPGMSIINGGGSFMAAYMTQGITGTIFEDINQDCLKGVNERGLQGRRASIFPGNFIIETTSGGKWIHDSLTAGTYTITFDTSGLWKSNCGETFTFEVTDPGRITRLPDFGLRSRFPCPAPEVSIHINRLRRCFVDKAFVQVCNTLVATDGLYDSELLVTFDTLLFVNHASVPFESLGNGQYNFSIDSLYPGECTQFTIDLLVSCDAILGQTLCAEVILETTDSCFIAPSLWTPSPGDLACTLEYDGSHIAVEASCSSQEVQFIVANTAESGNGNMTCYSPVHVFQDGVHILSDSIKLQGGESDTLNYSGDGRTWRLEVDQHPLHSGLSQPSATIELCGNAENWTSGLVNTNPQDDWNPHTDTYCEEVQGSYDPNDKRGYPVGTGIDHRVAPNGMLQYIIRFQNTGTDTAHKVVIRDTLDADVQIFSVRDGVSSHDYTFRMYGPRVLEWTFEPIMLPDSAANQEGSNGFVTFSVFQNRDLPDGTEITNSAAIYFDFNDPVITNSTLHTIGRMINSPSWTETKEVTLESCDDISYNNLTYTSSGTYWQVVEGGVNIDTLVTLNVLLPEDADNSIAQNGATLSSSITGATYQWFNCDVNSLIPNETNQSFTAIATGNYALIITQNACVDTSACYVIDLVGTIDNAFARSLSAHPNPNDGSFTIDFGTVLSHTEINVFNTLGTLVFHGQYQNTSQETLNLTQESGVYFIQVQARNKVGLVRIIVQSSH